MDATIARASAWAARSMRVLDGSVGVLARQLQKPLSGIPIPIIGAPSQATEPRDRAHGGPHRAGPQA